MKNKRYAPLLKAELIQLRADSNNIVDAAKRKGYTLDRFDLIRETEAAKNHFDLGCWLYYYRNKIYQANEEGFQARVDCMWRIFCEGLDRPNPFYRFFTVFEFGERQFDTLAEMGDAEQVVDAMRDRYQRTPNEHVKNGFAYFGWELAKRDSQLELI